MAETEKSEATFCCTVQEYWGLTGDTTYNHTKKFPTINLKFLTHCSNSSGTVDQAVIKFCHALSSLPLNTNASMINFNFQCNGTFSF